MGTLSTGGETCSKLQSLGGGLIRLCLSDPWAWSSPLLQGCLRQIIPGDCVSLSWRLLHFPSLCIPVPNFKQQPQNYNKYWWVYCGYTHHCELWHLNMAQLTGFLFLLDFKVSVIGTMLPTFEWILSGLSHFGALINLFWFVRFVHCWCFPPLCLRQALPPWRNSYTTQDGKRSRRTIVIDTWADPKSNFCSLCRGDISRKMIPPSVST